MAIDSTLYNGREVSHVNHTFRIDGVVTRAVKSFNSDVEAEFGVAKGTNVNSSATTTGTPTYTSTIEIYNSLYKQLIKRWGSDWMNKRFQIVVTIAIPGEPTATDVYYVERIKKRTKNTQEGPEPQVVSLDLYCVGLTEDGVAPFLGTR